MTSQLDSQSVTLNASGTGTLRFSVRGGRAWSVESIATSATAGPAASSVPFTLKVYRNQAQPTNLVTSSVTADLDTADGTPITVNQGEQLVAVFAGGTPGAVGTVTLSGTVIP
jgi:hypothetical protein